jgi:hypothetical protein
MDDKLTPRGKRLLIILAVTPWLFLLVYYGSPYLNSQRRHLMAIDQHIQKIGPQWDRFRAEHKGFEKVELFGYTGGDGMFGAYGRVASDEQVEQLRKFMESTSPPRPIYVHSVDVVGEDLFETNRVTKP